MAKPVQVTVFSDVLCVWAYVSQVRIDELKTHFGEKIEVHCHYLPIFGDTRGRVGTRWAQRGGLAGYRKHVEEVCENFGHVKLGKKAWAECIPCTSDQAHVFLHSYRLAQAQLGVAPQEAREGAETLAWTIRRAFFEDGLDIAHRDILLDLLGAGFDKSMKRHMLELMESGAALAGMAVDRELANQHNVTGSPTYILNHGRQTLYGNLGYKVLEANVQELLDTGRSDRASWC